MIGNRNLVLTPDMQADLVGEELTVKQVDAEAYRAWTKGNFVFRRERLESIMNDLARWYNVEIRYEEGTKEILFSGIMNRYETISETLWMIEKTGKVKFDYRIHCHGKKAIKTGRCSNTSPIKIQSLSVCSNNRTTMCNF